MTDSQIRAAIAKAAIEAGAPDVETAVSTLAPRAVQTVNPDGSADVMFRSPGGAFVESAADAVAGLGAPKPQAAPPPAAMTTSEYQAARKASRTAGARRL